MSEQRAIDIPGDRRTPECAVCGHREGQILTLSERMFGTGERFDYWQCARCGTLQIATIPADLGRYYPSTYHSLESAKLARRHKLFLTVAAKLDLRLLRQLSGVANLLEVLPQPPARVLDVGSGEGRTIRKLSSFGYECYGVDPFIGHDVSDDGVVVWKRELADVEGRFDAVMSIHSLEHMPDPHGVFADFARLLEPNGTLILRVPVMPNNVWDDYGTDWPQLDPPRHIYTFTLDALRRLASAHGFGIHRTVFDAEPWSLVAARDYRAGCAMKEPTVGKPVVTPQDVAVTAEANRSGRGDQVMLVLKSAGPG